MKSKYIYGLVAVIFLLIVGVYVYKYFYLDDKYQSGLKMALEEVRKDFGLESIMWPPRTGEFEGLNFSEDDGRILYDRCLTGDVTEEEVSKSFIKKFQVKELADLTGQLGDIAGGASTARRSAKAQLILSRLYSRRISNIAPTFNEKCAAKDYFPSNPIYQYVLYAEKFRIAVNLDRDGAHKLSQKKDIKGVGGIDFNVKLGNSGDSTLSLTANDVALGYKKATPSISRNQYSASCSKNILCEFGDSEYSVVISNIDDGRVSAVINNELLGVENKSVQLAVGKSHALRKFPAARDVISVRNLDAEKGLVELRILMLRWKVERGHVLDEEKTID